MPHSFSENATEWDVSDARFWTVLMEAESKEKIMNSGGSGSMGDHDTCWPKIRVVAEVSEDVHGESGYTVLGTRPLTRMHSIQVTTPNIPLKQNPMTCSYQKSR